MARRNVPLWTAAIATLFAMALALVHARGAALPGLATLEATSVDLRFRIRGPRDPATDRVVIVGIDDAARAADPDLIPTRRGHARLIDALTRCDPKVIALDYFFAAPEQVLPPGLADRVRSMAGAPMPADAPPAMATMHDLIGAIADELRGDDVLAAAIARSHRVVLAAFFRDGPPTRDVTEPPGLKLARAGQVADAGGGDPERRPLTADGVVFSLPAIARGAVGAGAVNDLLDADGVRRRMPLVVEYGGRHYLSLGLQVALAELGRPRDVRYVAGAATLTAADRELALTRAASLPLDVLGTGRLPRVSAADVLAGRCHGLAGKLVFVGMTYAASDKVATPLDPRADGVELHATLAENLLGDRVLRPASAAATLLATLALCAIACAAQLRRIRRRAWAPPVIALAAITGYVAIAQLAFSGGALLEVAAPVALAALVTIAATIGGLATEGREKAHLRHAFSQYVSRAIVDRIAADPARARLGGERKELTVLFSDIRGFSQLAEAMPPEALAAFLNEYLTPMTELVLASGGTLDKYIGDAIMAFWGAPADAADHAARACEVALAMQRALDELNARRRAARASPIAIGIGLNTGEVAVGNMGSAARFEYTVLGDPVNLASRLEGLTKEYGVTVLVGEATARAAGARFVFRELDLVRVKGRATAAPVFELRGRAGEAAPDPRWDAALARYRARAFADARDAFVALADDPAAAVMARRCDVLLATPPAADWDGVYDQRSK